MNVICKIIFYFTSNKLRFLSKKIKLSGVDNYLLL